MLIRNSNQPNRRKAFDGADFVLTTFRPGSQEQQEQDESIPIKYGLQRNETVVIGGIFGLPYNASSAGNLRGYVKGYPTVWILNYTNPTQNVPDTVQRISSLKVIGLCDGFIELSEDLVLL